VAESRNRRWKHLAFCDAGENDAQGPRARPTKCRAATTTHVRRWISSGKNTEKTPKTRDFTLAKPGKNVQQVIEMLWVSLAQPAGRRGGAGRLLGRFRRVDARETRPASQATAPTATDAPRPRSTQPKVRARRSSRSPRAHDPPSVPSRSRPRGRFSSPRSHPRGEIPANTPAAANASPCGASLSPLTPSPTPPFAASRSRLARRDFQHRGPPRGSETLLTYAC